MTQLKETLEKVQEESNLNRLVLLITLILVFFLAARVPLDSDLWWHLRAGEVSWTSGHAMLVDSLSYTRAGADWINHSWLSEIILYGVMQLGGWLAIGCVMALLATISIGLTYAQMQGPALLRASLCMLAVLVTAVVWSPRPQMASLALFALLAYLLYLYKWKQVNRIWLLPGLFMLWSNLHGGFALGLLLLGAVLAGEVLNHLLANTEVEVLSWRRWWILVGWSIASGLALLINPNGINTWRIPFQTVGVNVLQQFISEWASPDFHQLYQQPFLWLLILLFVAIGLSGRRADGGDLVSVALFAYLGLVARRNFGPFALVAAPVAMRALWAAIQNWQERMQGTRWAIWRDRWKKNGANRPLPDGLRKAINLSLVAILGLMAMVKVYINTQPQMMAAYEQSMNPARAVTWIETHHPQGRILNEYAWGGYLTWRLREYPVFVDGRTDLFGDEIIGEWMGMMQGGADWQQQVDQWDIRLVMAQPDRPLLKLLAGAGWKLLYQDDQAVVYGR